MCKKEKGRNIWYRLAISLILSAVLAACTPEGQVQETKPAITQTRVEIAVASATPNATATATKTELPSFTPTPEATSTPTATPTPEATPTPQAPEFPSDLVIHEEFRFDPERRMDEHTPEYKTQRWHVIIREQDLHLDETFTLGGGRYHVSAWADAWFMDKEGKGYHLSIPLMIFDQETFLVWGYLSSALHNLDSEGELGEQGRKIITEYFTGPLSDNPYFTEGNWDTADWCFTETQFRNCGEGNLRPMFMEIGYIPSADTDMTSRRWDGLRELLDFHRAYLGDVYTQEKVEAFWKSSDFDTRSLQLPDPNLPANFIIPLRIPRSRAPFLVP